MVDGRYRLEAVLGRGGMAIVCRAFDEVEEKTVALKQLLPTSNELQRSQQIELFAREYRTLAQLSHPSVIRVFAYGVDESGPYYTMELLGGSDLATLAPVSWRAACSYMRDICSCLALLHSRHLLHRDVSPRNVRCMGERAKLLDFGAMTAMGPVTHVIGTPALVAPEILDDQSLDGRYDLYALGGTLYWALTKRHAYPASSLSELVGLRDRPPPRPPSEFAEDIPEALDKLVLSLLAAQTEARPRNAAEVMEALSNIAGLDTDELLHVPLAYLTTPSLVGRESELERIRGKMERVCSGGSVVLQLTGEAGVGCSRLLDAAVLEGRLVGARVIRVEVQVNSRTVEDLARHILSRASDVMPDVTIEVTDPPLRENNDAAKIRLSARLRMFVEQACKRGPVVIAVDGAERLELAGQALLAALPLAAKQNLAVVFTMRAGAALDPSMRALDSRKVIELGNLNEAQTESLLRSVFGDVPGLPSVSAGIHELSAGNPAATLELAQHLVDTGRAKYALGGWVLPGRLARADLPSAWANAIDARLEALSPVAREVAESFAFAENYGDISEHYHLLTSHGSMERQAAALDELLASGLLLLEEKQYAFANAAYGERLRVQCNADRKRAIHGRLSLALATAGQDPIDVAQCQLRAERPQQAIDTLLTSLEAGSRWETAPDHYAPVLLAAIDACKSLGRPKRERFRLQRELLQVGEHLGVGGMREYFLEVIAQLELESGLAFCRDEQAPSEDATARLQYAFTKAQARFDALPEDERIMPPAQAIQALALTCRQASAFASVAMDPVLLKAIPSLEPFRMLSPALEATLDGTFPAVMNLQAGRFEQARVCFHRTLDRLLQPDKAGLDDDYHAWAISALRYALGHVDAGLGVRTALDYANELEALDAWVICAWDIRNAYYQRFGDWHQAEKCRYQIERLRVESGRRPPMVDTSARLELDAGMHAGDLTAVKRAMERLKELIELHPGYEPYKYFGPACMALIRGQYISALELGEQTLSMLTVGEHRTWPWAANCILRALNGLGRFESAKARGLEFLKQAQDAELWVMAQHIAVPLALAEAELGETDVALERMEEGIVYREQLGCRGLNLGWIYEARARLAILMRDEAAFASAAAKCAAEYGLGRSGSSLVAKYEALLMEARKAGLIAAVNEQPAVREADVSAQSSLTAGALLTGDTVEARCHSAVTTLMKSPGTIDVVIYSVHQGELKPCVSSLSDDAPTAAVECAYRALIDHEPPVSEMYSRQSSANLAFSEAERPAEGEWRAVVTGKLSGNDFVPTGVLVVCRIESGLGVPHRLKRELGLLLGNIS